MERRGQRREAPDQRRCMRKKAKLRKHLANGDYHTLGLAARRSPLFVPSERGCCCCSCITASARVIAKVTTRPSFNTIILLLDNRIDIVLENFFDDFAISLHLVLAAGKLHGKF